MALPATDSFTTGSNQALTVYSSNWTMINGLMQVLAASDDVHSNSGASEAGARWNADAFNNDQYSQISISAIGSGNDPYFGVLVRGASAANSYYGWYTGVAYGALFFFKIVTGTYTELAGGGTASAVNDVMRLEASGTTITPLRNGSSPTGFGPVTDASLASGSAGLAGYSVASQVRGDSWEGGNIGGAAAAVGTGLLSSVLMNRRRLVG